MMLDLREMVVGCAILGIAFSTFGIVLRIADRRLRKNVADTMLSVALFAIMWQVFAYLLIMTGYIRSWPELFNKGIPLYYLIAPCMYLYVVYRLRPSNRLHVLGLLHAIPFLFGLVDIMPYAMASHAEKQALMGRLVEDISVGFVHEYGFVPQPWHYFIKLSLAIVYLLLQWRLLFQVDREETTLAPRVLVELYLSTTIYTAILLVQVGMVLNIMFNKAQAAYILLAPGHLILISVAYLMLSVWICISPILRRTK